MQSDFLATKKGDQKNLSWDAEADCLLSQTKQKHETAA